jgi:hypothetical protein
LCLGQAKSTSELEQGTTRKEETGGVSNQEGLKIESSQRQFQSALLKLKNESTKLLSFSRTELFKGRSFSEDDSMMNRRSFSASQGRSFSRTKLLEDDSMELLG